MTGSFAKHNADDLQFRGAQRLEDADFACALQNGGVHGLEDDKEADDDSDNDNDVQCEIESRETFQESSWKAILHGPDGIVPETVGVMDLVDDRLVVAGSSSLR